MGILLDIFNTQRPCLSLFAPLFDSPSLTHDSAVAALFHAAGAIFPAIRSALSVPSVAIRFVAHDAQFKRLSLQLLLF